MIFEFSWSWYEDYRPTILEGPDKTQEEFEEDCKKAMKECFNSFMKTQEKEDMWAGLSDWVEFAAKKLEDYGYKIVKPICVNYWGLYLPKHYDKGDEDSEKQFPELQKEIAKMKDHNEKVENGLKGEK